MKCARPRLGMYMPGTGTGCPLRYVHSILGAIDLNEFDVRLFCDIQGVYEPRPEVRVVPLHSVPASAPTMAAPVKSRRRAIGRSLLPGIVRLWLGFGRQAS